MCLAGKMACPPEDCGGCTSSPTAAMTPSVAMLYWSGLPMSAARRRACPTGSDFSCLPLRPSRSR
ncbi:hypothetical protein [Mycobacteroides abscessus]|uniref:hypothetical protein n=1 Tax=Mycobacteroides abscessus TaxID=36809 RepID=UPI0022859A92|nr:hypothetical protein [Mycobacteroides abscessus]